MQRGKKGIAWGCCSPLLKALGGDAERLHQIRHLQPAGPVLGETPGMLCSRGGGGHSKDKSRGRVVGQRAGGVAACVCKLQYM